MIALSRSQHVTQRPQDWHGRLNRAALTGAGSYPLRYLADGVLYVAAYVALDWISFIHAWSVFGFTLWNPPPALSLALVATRGSAYIPLIFVAAMTSDYVVRESILGLQTAIASALILTLGFGGLGVVLRRAGPIDLLRGSMRDIIIVLLLIPAGVLVVATAYVVTFASFGFFLPEDYVRAVTAFWVGDVTGILAFLPFLLILLGPDGLWLRRLRGSAVDLAVFGLALLTSMWLIFVAGFVNELRFFYLLFIPVIWIAIRRGITGAAIGVLAVQSSVVAAVLVRSYPSDTFLAFQMFFLIIDATGLLLGAVVTARYQAEIRLRKQQADVDRVARMTTVGIMGSALAHQISQPLASIATYAHAAELLLDAKTIAVDRVRGTVREIVVETERAGRVLRQLRDLVAEGRIGMAPVDVSDIVQKVTRLLQHQHALSPIPVVLQTNATPAVMGDAAQLEQVVLNVMTNAFEATMASKRNGPVTVVTRSAGQFVEIAVDDEGPGIDPELADRLFEPFVTSKSHGMGLGLAICRTILEAHGGTIEHQTREPLGTRFIIRVPVHRMGQ